MEGGTLYGLSAALNGEITIQNGRVVQRHFNDYRCCGTTRRRKSRRTSCRAPRTPGGIGEPSTALAAGALVNAIAAATGKRIYRLPIRAEQLPASRVKIGVFRHGPGFLTPYARIVRRQPVDDRAFRHDARGIDVVVRHVVVTLDVIEVDGVTETWPLEEVARVAPQVRIVDQPPQIALEVPEVYTRRSAPAW